MTKNFRIPIGLKVFTIYLFITNIQDVTERFIVKNNVIFLPGLKLGNFIYCEHRSNEINSKAIPKTLRPGHILKNRLSNLSY